MSIGALSMMGAFQANRNRSVNAALALLAMKQNQAPAPVTSSSTIVVRRISVGTGSDTGTGAGSGQQPYQTLHAAVAAIGDPADKGEFERLYVLECAPGDYSGEGLLVLPSRQWAIVAPNCQLPPIQFNIDFALRFGSTRTPALCISGEPGNQVYSFGAASMTPSGLCRLGDGSETPAIVVARKSAINVVGIVQLSDCVINGALKWRDDANVVGHFVEVAWDLWRCAAASAPSGDGIVPVTGSTPDRAVLWVRDSWLPDPTYVVSVNAINEIGNSVWDAQATVQIAAPAILRRGIHGTFVGADATWTGPAGSCFLDAYSNYILKANAAGIVAAQKTIMDDVVP